MRRLFIVFVFLPALLFAQVQLPLSLQTPPNGTSHSAMMQFLDQITVHSKRIEMETPGKSNLGREIPVVYFPKRSLWKKENATVMIFAQQHGNEPSGKEALLMLLHELYLNPKSKPYDRLNLILAPMANPDGNEAHQRRNNNRIDLNRNHVILTEPETRLLHDVFEKYQPEVTLDVHEYGAGGWLAQGYLKDFGEQLDCISNPAIPPELKRFAFTEILDPTIDNTRLQGVKANRYLITQEKLDAFVRHSTTDINDGRNGFGIQYTLSFILEGRNGLSKSDRIWERGKNQLTMIQSFLSVCNEKSDRIAELIRSTRTKFAEQIPDSVIIQADYTEKFSRPLTVSLTLTKNFKDTSVVLPDYRPYPEPLVTVITPKAYLIEKPTSQLIDLLNRQHIAFRSLTRQEKMNVEQFEITGSDTLRYESRDTAIPAGKFVQVEKIFGEGDILVPLENVRAVQIVQIMEPQSFYGLSHYEEFQDLVQGEVYPIYRLIR